jgi:predicted small lipoprotein YifL
MRQSSPQTTLTNMNKLFSIIALLLSFSVLTACGERDPNAPVTHQDKAVSFDTLESQRVTSKANAYANGMQYIRENPRFQEMGEGVQFEVVSHVDSSITSNCPQGDGWATISISANTKERDVRGRPVVVKYSAKCSTVSASVGCYLAEDFVKKSFAQEEGSCQPTNKVPFPLPKVAGAQK